MRALRADIAALREAAWARDVRWVGDGQLHLTLRFMGDIVPADADRYVALLERGLERIAPVTAVSLSAPRLFPSASRPRVIARMAAPETALLALAGLAERCAQDVGQEAEARSFNGHITLGRTPRVFDPRVFDLRGFGAPVDLGPMQMGVRAITLFESTLTPRGSIYRRIAEFAPR